MSLKLNDLLKKAEKKGITQKFAPPSSTELLRTWQQESVLYAADKLEPNLSQSEAKVEPKLSQTEAKVEPNLSQTRAKVEPSKASEDLNLNKLEPKVEPKVEPNLSQTRAKVKSNLSQSEAKLEPNRSFSSLTGLQRKIVLFIHEICQTILEQKTNPLSIEFISNQCQSPKSAVRKAIQRLELKEIILRADFKNGRGGWTRYQLPDQIYQEILRLKNKKLEPNLSQSRAKLESNLSQSEAKLRTELRTELEPNVSSSSSLNIKTTTTELEEEWNFDITPYTCFGFTYSRLKQIALLGVLSATEVEQSLIEFNYDIDNHSLPFIKTNKINFLMGLLRAGHLYVSEGFKNEQQAMISEMARRAEAKRKKRLEEKFGAWEASLNNEERNQVLLKLPTSLMVLEKTYGISNEQIKNWYFDYFIQNVKN